MLTARVFISDRELLMPWHIASLILNTEAAEKTDLGKLPGTAVALLVTLAVAWILMGAYVVTDWLKKKK